MNDSTSELIDALRSAQEIYEQQSFNNVGSASRQWSNSTVILLSGLVLAFMTIALILSTILLSRKQAEAHEVLRLFGILSIVGLSTLLLITGYDNEQLAPIVGLFGAISGYLLGKDQSEDRHKHTSVMMNERKAENQTDAEEDDIPLP